MGRTGGYATFGLQGRWSANQRLSLDARMDNLFDRRYSSFRMLGDADEVLRGFDDPRFLGRGAPRGAWRGSNAF